MTRRASLPGAAELFRTTVATGGGVIDGAAVPAPAVAPPVDASGPRPVRAVEPAPRERRGSSGRERHDEKITVYVSAQELLDLESARLRLRAEHGVAVDRGRIVREALAVVLADLDDAGADSTLVRRLREP
jgi:hypothetical protein